MYACSMVGVRIHWGNQVATDGTRLWLYTPNPGLLTLSAHNHLITGLELAVDLQCVQLLFPPMVLNCASQLVVSR